MTFRNSPFWTLHTLYCTRVSFLGVTVLAPRAVGNTDGIDPDSCTDVLIDSCFIDVGDDGISLKSDYRVDPVTGTVVLLPTARVHIVNTTVLSRNVVRPDGSGARDARGPPHARDAPPSRCHPLTPPPLPTRNRARRPLARARTATSPTCS